VASSLPELGVIVGRIPQDVARPDELEPGIAKLVDDLLVAHPMGLHVMAVRPSQPDLDDADDATGLERPSHRLEEDRRIGEEVVSANDDRPVQRSLGEVEEGIDEDDVPRFRQVAAFEPGAESRTVSLCVDPPRGSDALAQQVRVVAASGEDVGDAVARADADEVEDFLRLRALIALDLAVTARGLLGSLRRGGVGRGRVGCSRVGGAFLLPPAGAEDERDEDQGHEGTHRRPPALGANAGRQGPRGVSGGRGSPVT
jgi:hypothetical protein